MIIHDLPISMAGHAQLIQETGGTGRKIPVIGYSTWEAQTIQDDTAAEILTPLDELWVPNAAAVRMLERRQAEWRGHNLREKASGVPVAAVPHPYDPDDVAERKPPSEGAPYTFSWWGAVNIRKNPTGLIRAFCHTFRPAEHVKLHIHSAQMEKQVALAMLGMTGMPQKDMPLIEFTSQPCPISELVGDCYVTASRGEGWNLPAFESAAMGVHVISPARLGSDDYLLRTSAALYGATYDPAICDVSIGDGGAVIVKGAQGLTARDLWLSPDLVHLGACMRNAFSARTRSLAVNASFAETYNYHSVGRMMRDRLENLVSNNSN